MKKILPVILAGMRKGWFLYLMVVLIFVISVGHPKTIERIKVQKLNLKMPDQGYLFRFEKTPQRFDKRQLLLFLEYYARVNRYVPDLPDVLGLMGYVHFYYGTKDQAISDFKRAAEIRPDIFSFAYNLGVIYYNDKDYEKAIYWLRKAIQANPEETLKFVYASNNYSRIIPRVVNMGEVIQIRLREGYEKALSMMILSRYYLKDYDNMYRDAKYAVALNIGAEYRFYYYAGVAAYFLKEYKKALYNLQESIKINKEYPAPFYYLGLSAKALGHEAEALTALTVGMEISKKRKDSNAATKVADNIQLDFQEKDVYINLF